MTLGLLNVGEVLAECEFVTGESARSWEKGLLSLLGHLFERGCSVTWLEVGNDAVMLGL